MYTRTRWMHLYTHDVFSCVDLIVRGDKFESPEKLTRIKIFSVRKPTMRLFSKTVSNCMAHIPRD